MAATVEIKVLVVKIMQTMEKMAVAAAARAAQAYRRIMGPPAGHARDPVRDGRSVQERR